MAAKLHEFITGDLITSGNQNWADQLEKLLQRKVEILSFLLVSLLTCSEKNPK